MSNKTSDISKTARTQPVNLLTYCSDKSFEAVISDFEKQLGRFDEAKAIASGANLESTVKQMEGELGLMIIGVLQMDRVLPAFATGSPAHARQYQVGNPLIASQMAKHDVLAALYVPPRVLIYTASGKTWIAYDQPSSSLGRLGCSDIDRTARDLDQKFEKLATTALA
jgi:hypothetical protein